MVEVPPMRLGLLSVRVLILLMFMAGIFCSAVHAAPVVIVPAQAAAPAKTASGSGACATAVHLSSFYTLRSPAAASFYVSQPQGMNTVDGKISLQTGPVHFVNGSMLSDFQSPQPLPFSSLPGAVAANDGQNTAMRVRGYVNVRAAATYTFGVQADDGYELTIAGTSILQSMFTGASLHDSRQVQFQAPGLYPFELVYFQQTGAAVIALAKSQQADVEVSAAPNALPASFELVPAAELFSALAGTSNCTECQRDADCGTNNGTYCRDGLCQGCVLGARCGLTCQQCDAATPACSGTACVECSADDTSLCDAKGFLCISNACVRCGSDNQCGTGKICDGALGQCIPRPKLEFAGGCSMSPASSDAATERTSSSPALLMLILAAMCGLFFFDARSFGAKKFPRWQRNRSQKALLILVALIQFAAWSQHARAQTPDLQSATFNAQTFRPTLGTGNLFTVEGAAMPRSIWPMGSVVLELANRPLRMVLADTGETYAATVPAMLTTHLLAGAGITKWFSAGLALPVVLYQGFDVRTPTSVVPNTPTVAGAGDLRLLTKFHILEKNGFGLAAVPQLTFPTGAATSFRGDNTFGIEPRLAADYHHRTGVFVALNVGVYVRTYNRTVDYDLVRVSDQLRYGFGVGVPLPKSFTVSAELTGAIGFSKFTGGSLYTPLEWYAGAKYPVKSGVELALGIGGGLVGAVGSPNFRAFAGVSYVLPSSSVRSVQSQRKPDDAGTDVTSAAGREGKTGSVVAFSPTSATAADLDFDGVRDSEDRCPKQPGPAENRGCPDVDQDQDGTADRLDKCPSAAGPKDNDGCPLVEIGESSIRLSRPLRFSPGTAELSPISRPTVAALVTALRANPTIRKVLIDVGASGRPHAVRKLAARRAAALKDDLVDAGAAADLLAIRAISENSGDEISRVDLVRDAVVARPEAGPTKPAKGDDGMIPAPLPPASVVAKPETTSPDSTKPEPPRAAATRADQQPRSSSETEQRPQSSRRHASHRERTKSKKSGKEKRNRH
jgi:outer membrane protein OmpA-like peptidoglycan-associated protein